MRAQGVLAFVPYTGNLEGVVSWLYQDILGLVTVAIGNLVDPMSYALSLPFVMRDGSPAPRDVIAAEWQAVKADTKAAKLGHRYAERLSSIRLTPDGIAQVVNAKRLQNEAILNQRCPEFNDWPVDAQLALHSWAWACGPGGNWPRFMDALKRKDFATAAVESHIDERGPDKILGTADDNWGLKPRNVSIKQMFRNAADAMASGGMFDFDELRYPVKGLVHGAVALPTMPDNHVAPKQEAVIVDDSCRIVHPLDYVWPSYRDA